jgi:large subunit ribosomal protein L24
MKIKKGDLVRVIQGKDRGKEGVVMKVFPKTGKVIVEGVNVAKRHQRATRATMQGGIIDKDMPMDASNVMLVSQGKTSRVGARVEPDGSRTRVAKKTGEALA